MSQLPMPMASTSSATSSPNGQPRRGRRAAGLRGIEQIDGDFPVGQGLADFGGDERMLPCGGDDGSLPCGGGGEQRFRLGNVRCGDGKNRQRLKTLWSDFYGEPRISFFDQEPPNATRWA